MARAPFKLRSGNTTPFKQMGSSPARKTYKEAWGGMSPEKQATYGEGDEGFKKFKTEAEDWWKSEAGQKRATTDPKFKHRITKADPKTDPKPDPKTDTEETSKELRKKAGWTGDTPEGKKKMEEGAKKYAETKKKRERWGVFTSEGRAKIKERREKIRAERDAKKAAKKEAKRAAKEAKKPAWKKRKEKREAQNIAIYGEK